MAAAADRVICTMSTDMRLGMMCLTIILNLLSPAQIALSIYSRLLSVSVMLRVSLAKAGVLARPMARTTFMMLPPSMIAP